MKISQIGQCLTTLNFEPLHDWPEALPALAWSNYLLCGFDRLRSDGHSETHHETHGEAHPTTHKEVVDVAQSHSVDELARTLHSIYPKLSLPELARLHQQTRPVPHLEALVPQLIELQGWRWSTDFGKLLKILTQTPRLFQDWVSRRELALRDLQILNLVPDIAKVQPLLEEIARRQVSKSHGAQILEWGLEILLMESSSLVHVMASGDLNDEKWVKHLKDLRFPMTSEKDQTRRKRLLELPWPSHVQTRWTRQGDEAGVEIRFTATSLLDFQRKIRGLTRVGDKLAKDEQLWNT